MNTKVMQGYAHIDEQTYNRIIEYLISKPCSRVVEKIKLIRIMWIFGLRVSEVLLIKPSDFIRREDGYILLVHRKKKRKNQIDEVEIPTDIAIEYISWCQANMLPKDEPIWKISRQAVHRFLKDIGKKLGIRLHPHMFRHGRVYALIDKGIHPAMITRMMGWNNINMIMTYYHPKKGDMRKCWF